MKLAFVFRFVLTWHLLFWCFTRYPLLHIVITVIVKVLDYIAY